MSETAKVHVVEVTPTLDTSAYADSDRLGSIEEIACGNDIGHPVTLMNLVVLDKDDQGVAFDILFFNESPTVASADNANISITDAELEKCVGIVSVTADDYADLLSAQVATKNNIGLGMKPVSGSGSLYALLVSRGAPTYTASGLVFKYYFAMDRS